MKFHIITSCRHHARVALYPRTDRRFLAFLGRFLLPLSAFHQLCRMVLGFRKKIIIEKNLVGGVLLGCRTAKKFDFFGQNLTIFSSFFHIFENIAFQHFSCLFLLLEYQYTCFCAFKIVINYNFDLISAHI